jgi:hypothetical protein
MRACNGRAVVVLTATLVPRPNLEIAARGSRGGRGQKVHLTCPFPLSPPQIRSPARLSW